MPAVQLSHLVPVAYARCHVSLLRAGNGLIDEAPSWWDESTYGSFTQLANATANTDQLTWSSRCASFCGRSVAHPEDLAYVEVDTSKGRRGRGCRCFGHTTARHPESVSVASDLDATEWLKAVKVSESHGTGVGYGRACGPTAPPTLSRICGHHALRAGAGHGLRDHADDGGRARLPGPRGRGPVEDCMSKCAGAVLGVVGAARLR